MEYKICLIIRALKHEGFVFVKPHEFVDEQFAGNIFLFEELCDDFAGIVGGTCVAHYPIIY
jgi:hypothetical protein